MVESQCCVQLIPPIAIIGVSQRYVHITAIEISKNRPLPH